MTEEIILDTNFLVAPFQLSVSVFEELERLYFKPRVCTIDDAVQEARSIESGKYGKLVEKLIETEDIEVLETTGEGTVDDLLVELSRRFVIATNDKELKERVIEKGGKVVIIRGKNHLEVRE